MPDAIPGGQAVVLRIGRQLASAFSFASNLPQPQARGLQGVPRVRALGTDEERKPLRFLQ